MALQTPPFVDLGKYIEVRFFEQRPHIRGRRVPVATIAYNYHHNAWTVPETAYNFGLSEPEVLAALLYYEENKELIDSQEEEEMRLGEEMRRLYGNKEN